MTTNKTWKIPMPEQTEDGLVWKPVVRVGRIGIVVRVVKVVKSSQSRQSSNSNQSGKYYKSSQKV